MTDTFFGSRKCPPFWGSKCGPHFAPFSLRPRKLGPQVLQKMNVTVSFLLKVFRTLVFRPFDLERRLWKWSLEVGALLSSREWLWVFSMENYSFVRKKAVRRRENGLFSNFHSKLTEVPLPWQTRSSALATFSQPSLYLNKLIMTSFYLTSSYDLIRMAIGNIFRHHGL